MQSIYANKRPTAARFPLYKMHPPRPTMVSCYRKQAHTPLPPSKALWGSIYICTRCGAVSREVIKNLAKPCINIDMHEEPPPGGKNNLRAYAANRPPQGCKDWPHNSLDQKDRCILHQVQQAVNDLPPQYVPDVLEELPSDAENQQSEELSSLGESGSSSSD